MVGHLGHTVVVFAKVLRNPRDWNVSCVESNNHNIDMDYGRSFLSSSSSFGTRPRDRRDCQGHDGTSLFPFRPTLKPHNSPYSVPIRPIQLHATSAALTAALPCFRPPPEDRKNTSAAEAPSETATPGSDRPSVSFGVTAARQGPPGGGQRRQERRLPTHQYMKC